MDALTIEAPPERPVAMPTQDALMLRRSWRKHGAPKNGDHLVKVSGVWWLVPGGCDYMDGLFDRQIEE